jgi:hypothetical protein
MGRVNRRLVAAVLGASVFCAGAGQAQTPPAGQGGFYDGTPRDYDSFLWNYRGPQAPGSIRVLPAPPLSPVRALRLTEPMDGLTGRIVSDAEAASRRGGVGQMPAAWTYQAKSACYVAEFRGASGATFYWVFWPKQPRYFYCYSPLRERYVGLYETALRLYRPYNPRAKQWEEASAPPGPPPPEAPDLKAKPVLAAASTPAIPEPPPFKVEALAPVGSETSGRNAGR